MRIIGGNLKGKKILAPTDKSTRPLKDRVRESIFNIIEHSKNEFVNLKSAKVLDLFSGTGSFGIECISRGAEKVVFFENYINSIKDIGDVFYYDLNVYKKNKIKTYPIRKCTKQISFIKKVAKSIFIGGGVSEKNAHEIINIAKPDGLDISRSLKGKKTSLSNLKLKKFLSQVAAI